MHLLISEERSGRYWPSLLAVALLAVAGLAVWLGGQQEQAERERRELGAEQARLEARREELARQGRWLEELERLPATEGFYVVVQAGSRFGHLRLQDRSLRRFPCAPGPLTLTPGRYTLASVHPAWLDWNGLTLAAQPPGSDAAPDCPSPAAPCLLVPSHDFAALRRVLKPGAPLLLLP